MINKAIMSISAKKRTSLLNTLLLATVLVYSVFSATDYCVTNKPHATLALLPNQIHILTLGDYIRGYDLTFTSQQHITARPSNPLDTVGQMSFKTYVPQGYLLVNADVLQSQDKKWLSQQGIVFYQKDYLKIGILTTDITGTKQIGENITFTQYMLPEQANCFSARIVDFSKNVVIDCQSISSGNQQDLTCFVNDQKKMIQCRKVESLNVVKDRKSQVLSVNNQLYLVTATYSREAASEQMTYLTLYHIDLGSSRIDFVNIIDGYQLNLDYQLKISDFDILPNGNLIVHDMAKSQLLQVQYTLPNQIKLVGKPWVYGSQGVQIQVTDIGTLLIATSSHVQEYDLKQKLRVFRYELEDGDNQVTEITANTYGVVVQTRKNNLFIYQRIMSNVNYLLGKLTLFASNDYMMSPFTNAMYLFNEDGYEIVQLTSGYLTVKSGTQRKNITISATSSMSQCKFILQLIPLESTANIIQKQNITSKHIRSSQSSNQSQIYLNLQQIYSGQNLQYQLPQSTAQIKYSLEHLQQFKINSIFNNSKQQSKLTQVVNINRKTYMMLGFMQGNATVQTCVVDESKLEVNCKQTYSNKLFDKQPISLTGKQRKSGEVVFVWTYAQEKFEVLHCNDGNCLPSYQMSGNLEYSSVIIAQDRIFFVMKKFNQIRVLYDLTATYQTTVITRKDFRPLPNSKSVGFYPRQVYLHPRSSQLFYIKFPAQVCLMVLSGARLLTVQCVQMFEQGEKTIPEQKWTVVMGVQSYVMLTPSGLRQYSLLGAGKTLLHSMVVNFACQWPVYFTQFTNTVVFKTMQNKIIYYRLSKTSIDSLYYETSLVNSRTTVSAQEDIFSTEGYWTVSTSNWLAYRQVFTTSLTLQLANDQSAFKSDVQFSIKVIGGQSGQTIDTNSDITVINYPTKINDLDQSNNTLIKLPESTENTKISIDTSKYFNGSRANYHIVCDYCENQILLQTAFKNYNQNTDIKGAQSIIQVFNDGHVVILSSDNTLNLVNNKSQVVVSKKIQNVRQCSEMGYELMRGLLVFCESTEQGQEMLAFDVSKQNITLRSTYPLHEQSLIKTANEIIITQIDQSSAWVFVQDNDISQVYESLTKSANIKVFIWTEQYFHLKTVLTSQSFGLAGNLQPINDIDVLNNRVLLASIGNIGIGYAKLSFQSQSQNILVNPHIIQLNAVPELQALIIDDSIFQQVKLMTSTGNSQVQILVTSTSSLTMVLTFEIMQNSQLKFTRISQIYNRYGTLNMLNWHFATNQVLLLAYYNVETSEQYVAFYDRTHGSGMNVTQMTEAITIKISQRQLRQHSAYLTSQNILFASLPEVVNQNTTKQAQIITCQVSSEFNLMLNYTAPGNFSKIALSASNFYASSFTEIKVQFGIPQPTPDTDSGLRWYTIMIIILIVLIIVGVAYGMYLKMIKNRKDKKVSLLTQGQQVDQVI